MDVRFYELIQDLIPGERRAALREITPVHGNVIRRSRKIKVPEWRAEASEQRDEFAERMRY